MIEAVQTGIFFYQYQYYGENSGTLIFRHMAEFIRLGLRQIINVADQLNKKDLISDPDLVFTLIIQILKISFSIY